MIQIKNFISDVAVRQTISEGLEVDGVINQMAFYLGKGADLYYDPLKAGSAEKYDYFKIAQLLEKVLADKKGLKVAVVSLGCGNCEKDKIILEHLQEMGYNVAYFGVDSSITMLNKAKERVLKDITFEAHLICANFGAFNFKKELNNLLKDYEVKIYLFMGSTLSNLRQTYIANKLKSILHTGDYLLLDIGGFETITSLVQARLFQRYRGYLTSPPEVDFFLAPLKALGVPRDCGRLILKVDKDSATQAQVFIFGLKISTEKDYYFEDEEITLSPNEYIRLYHILIYDLKELVKFLETKKFTLKDQVIGDFMNQLLLERR